MHDRSVDATRDDLHRIGMPAIGPNGFEATVMG